MVVGSMRGELLCQFFVEEDKKFLVLVGDLFVPVFFGCFGCDGLVDLIKCEGNGLGPFSEQ